MEIVTIAVHAAAGIALKKILKDKLGVYEDPENLLDEFTQDVAHSLILTVTLEGGYWIIKQVFRTNTPVAVDPKLEAEIDAKLARIRKQIRSERRQLAERKKSRLGVFKTVEAEIKKLEAVLRKKGKVLSGLEKLRNSVVPFVNIFTVHVAGYSFFSRLSKFRFEYDADEQGKEQILIFCTYNSCDLPFTKIKPTYDGKVLVSTTVDYPVYKKLETQTGFAALDSARPVNDRYYKVVHETAVNVVAHVRNVVNAYLEVIERE